MVKLTGPALSTEAAGSLADQVTFSNWKGRAYLKFKSTPAQPNTPAQIAIRAAVAFTSTIWKHLPSDDTDTWRDLAAASNISPFNAMQAVNIARWRDENWPCTQLPTGRALLPQTFDGWTATPGPGHVKHLFTSNTHNEGRGFTIHRNDTMPISPEWHNLVKILPIVPWPGPFTWTDHLPAGTYNYTAVCFAKDASIGTNLYRTGIVVPP